MEKRGLSTVEKLPQYKMEILNRVLESEKLTKLLAYDRADALFQPVVEDPSSLLYSKVFPYRFVPDPTESQSTYLTVGVNGLRPYQSGFNIFNDYRSGEFYFYMFTHVDLMRTQSGVRQDLMMAEISRMFDGSKGIGMGEMTLRYTNELWMHNNKFGGYSMAFTIADLK